MSPPALKRLPRRTSGQLAPAAAHLLHFVETHGALETGGILGLTCTEIAGQLHWRPADVEKHAISLQSRGYFAYSSRGLALISPLQRELKREIDRNRDRASRATALQADWSLRQRVYDLFPELRAPVKRSKTYNVPAAFMPLLKEHAHSHRNEQPANVEVMSEAIYPGELTTALTMIAEQQSARRTVHLLYTRKALYVAVERHAKR